MIIWQRSQSSSTQNPFRWYVTMYGKSLKFFSFLTIWAITKLNIITIYDLLYIEQLRVSQGKK